MVSNGRWGAPLGILAISLFLASSAQATVMVEVPLEEMIHGADAIVHGTVIRSDVRMSIDDGEMEPYTYTTIRVGEWLAGSGGQTVVIRELGGTFRGITQETVGVPRYALGDEVVVFLERRDDGSLRTMAMAQGKFLVRRGVGTESTVTRDLDGVAFLRWADGRQTISHPGRPASMQLEAFLDYVRQTRGQVTTVPVPEGVVR